MISNLVSLIKSICFAAGRSSRKEIEWNKLEIMFFQTTSIVISTEAEPIKYEEIAKDVGGILSASLADDDLKVSREQSHMIFSALNIICLEEDLQKKFRRFRDITEIVLKDEVQEASWDEYDNLFSSIKDDLSRFGIVFGPELSIEEIKRKIINETPKKRS